MKRSIDRILTAHVGSVPRPADLLDVVQAKEEGKPVDAKAHAARLRDAVAEVVRKQIDLGIDIIDDGEYGKPSFVSYVNERLGGFEFDREARQSPWAGSREAQSFPEFYGDGHVAARPPRPAGPPARTTWSAPRPSPIAAWRNSRPTSTTSRRRSTAPSRRKLSCRPSRRRARRIGSATAITRPRRSIYSPSPMRCARN